VVDFIADGGVLGERGRRGRRFEPFSTPKSGSIPLSKPFERGAKILFLGSKIEDRANCAQRGADRRGAWCGGPADALRDDKRPAASRACARMLRTGSAVAFAFEVLAKL
jgi:hypothetical protein